MKSTTTSLHKWPLLILKYSCWTFIFTVIYAQSPLFTSNQNQYFLHGLAESGVGFLKNDWLAKTLDPTPVFSFLINLTYRVSHSYVLFYLYYAILLGIYLFSLLGIAERLFKSQSQKLIVIYLALLLGFHSAALRFFISRVVNPNWSYLFESGVAGQRLLGPVFQPSTFGVFLVLSIYLFLIGRRYAAVLASVLAVFFHPTYLLSAALLTLTYMWAVYKEEGDVVKPIQIGFVSFISVIPILAYVYRSFGSSPSGISQRAMEILVNFRIPHHALIANWLDVSTFVQIAIVFSAIILLRRTKLFPIMLILIILTIAMTLLQSFTQSNTLALLFPWRVSVVLVPLSTSIIIAYFVFERLDHFLSHKPNYQSGMVYLSLIGMTGLIIIGATRFTLDLNRQRNSDDRPMMNYVYKTKSIEENYLIPIKLQDFRLVTGAPVYVDFKSIPYQSQEVLEWYARIQAADRFYRNRSDSCTALDQIIQTGGVTHVIIEKSENMPSCPSFNEIFQDDHYLIEKIQ